MLLALLSLLSGPAHAACSFSQTRYADAVEVLVQAGPGVVSCRTVYVDAPLPLTVEAWRRSAEGGEWKLRTGTPLPGGGWQVSLPDLRAGEALRLAVRPVVEGLVVGLLPWREPAPRQGRLDEVWRFDLDPRHPGWGFADPRHGRTHVERRWTFEAAAPPQVLPAPGVAESGSGEDAVPRAVRWKGGAGELAAGWDEPGATPQGRRVVPPGSFTLTGAGVELVGSGGPGVTVVPVEGGLRFEAPQGGEVRWRVARVGETAVIPDVTTFVAGLTERFRARSLPEPAVPVRLKGLRVPELMVEALYDEVRALVPYADPATDPLSPRPLNRAWRSGWATPLEKGLILHRMLGQEKIVAEWVLTGAAPDPSTLTGYDVALVRAHVGDVTVWLDPSCTVCRPGQISWRWQGQSALGAVGEVPRQPGRLARRITISGTEYIVRHVAEGAAGRWLREVAAEVDEGARPGRLLKALGIEDGSVASVAGLTDAEGDVTVEVHTRIVPGRPFAGAAPPWDGEVVDE